MNYLNPALATCLFELKRSFSFQRMAVTVVLCLFPPTMLLLLILGSKFAENGQIPTEMVDYSTFLSVFLVALVVLLSLLLWATPNVYSELEGKSWSFVASRPGGRISVYLGKFLASVVVSYGIAFIAATACVILQKVLLNILEPMKIWLSMNLVFFLASLIYSALFSTIGTIFIKRAMLVGAAFLIGFDVILGLMPNAIINKLTVRFHLQEIGVGTMGWFFPTDIGPESEYRQIFGEAWPTWVHVLVVLGATVALMAFGIYVIVKREYVTADET
ncbi:MAG: hypothetical protein AAFN77_13470 [Planctomycetota bacterium]